MAMETGTFEWAMALMRAGHRMRRNVRDESGALCFRRVVHMGAGTTTLYQVWPSGFVHEYLPCGDDLRAKDWDLARQEELK